MSQQLPIYKVVVIGDGNVGKTTLIRRYCEGRFEQSRVMTIGVDFQTKNVKLGESEVKLSIWDVAGQDRFGSFRDTFYNGARAAALVYDVTVPESFANLEKWLNEIRAVMPKIPLLLIANKTDLEAAVPAVEAEQWGKARGIPFLPTSAASGRNVERLFLGLAFLASRA